MNIDLVALFAFGFLLGAAFGVSAGLVIAAAAGIYQQRG